MNSRISRKGQRVNAILALQAVDNEKWNSI